MHKEIALWHAAKSCNAEKLQQLVSSELDEDVQALLDKTHPAKGTTPLMVAATRKYGMESVRVLIGLGADLNVTDTCKRQNTALHYAAYNNRVAQLELLLETGADILALNGKGHTALDVARLRGQKEAAAALTSRLQLHSGWLLLRSKSIMGFWKRRWCVLLACNSKRTATEMCIFRSPNKVHPEAVMWQDSSTTHCAVQECRISESANGFKLDANVVYQKLRSRRYSRYKSSGRTHVHKANLQPREFLFAYGTESNQVAWTRVLEHRQREYTNTTISSTHTNSLYRSSAGSGAATVDTARQPSFESPVRKNGKSAAQADKLSPVRKNVEYAAQADKLSPVGKNVEYAAQADKQSPVGKNVEYAAQADKQSPVGKNVETAVQVDKLSLVRKNDESAAQVNKLSPQRTSESARSTIRASAPTFVEDANGFVWGDMSASRASVTSKMSPLARVISISGDPNEPQPLVRDQCIVCIENHRDSVCIPCGHVAGCYDCMRAVTQETSSCPVCRAHVDGVVKING